MCRKSKGQGATCDFFKQCICFLCTVIHQSIQPPGLLRGICAPCQSRGWGISKFCAARGLGFANPGATLELLEDVSIDNEYEFQNEISDFAYCASVLRISTFSGRPVKLHYYEFSPKTRSGQNDWEELVFRGKFQSFYAVSFRFQPLFIILNIPYIMFYVKYCF